MKKLYKCFKNEKRVNLFDNMKQLNYLIFLTQKKNFITKPIVSIL